MKITKRQLRRIIREARAGHTKADEDAADYNDGYNDAEDGKESNPDLERNSEYSRGYMAGLTGSPDRGYQGIKEEKAKIPLKEYSDYESHSDISDHMEDMFGMMEEVMTKYVDSGWLAGQDQVSLAQNLEKLFDDMNMLNNTFSQLASGRAGTKTPPRN